MYDAAVSVSGKVSFDVVKVVQGDADLFEVVAALHSSSGFSCGLHGGQEQCDEHSDDGDDDEQFDEREGAIAQLSYFAPPQVNILFDITISFEFELLC